MKASLFFKLFTGLFSATVILLVVYNSTLNPLMCEYPHPYDQDNLFYKIKERENGVWDVLFKNVRINYEISSSSRAHLGDYSNQNFHLKQITRDVPGSDFVDSTKVHNNVVDAVMEHFNEIQRGNIHTNAANYINPNPHGKGIYCRSQKSSSPLDQFLIREIVALFYNLGGSTKLLFTNMGLYLLISTSIASTISLLYNKLKGLVSSFWSLNKESLYSTVLGTVTSQINMIKGQNYLPFIYTLFIFIFISNLIGMIPYSFSSTSHFVLTFFISFTIVVGSTLLGFSSYKGKFFSIFVPSGCPTGLLPLLVLIEFISYLARNVSLGLRLAANILSGHMLLNILSGFTYNIMASGFIMFLIGLIPLAFITAFSTLELGICFIQAQVFSVLSSSYIKDGTLLH